MTWFSCTRERESRRGKERERERERKWKWKWKIEIAPHLFGVFSCLWTDTDIKTVVTCWYDADMTVYRSFSDIFLTSNASRVAGLTYWHGLIKIRKFNIQFDFELYSGVFGWHQHHELYELLRWERSSHITTPLKSTGKTLLLKRTWEA